MLRERARRVHLAAAAAAAAAICVSPALRHIIQDDSEVFRHLRHEIIHHSQLHHLAQKSLQPRSSFKHAPLFTMPLPERGGAWMENLTLPGGRREELVGDRMRAPLV